MELLVGFDLDMTLVDSRAGIVRTFTDVLAERGVKVSDEQVWPSIGIPLEATLALWLTPDQVPDAVADYRERYPSLGVPLTVTLPGASDAFAAVRAAGGRVAVISAKVERAVHAVLEQVGLSADIVVGDRFAHGKAEVLREHGAQIYVGDHPGDVVAARGADCVAVAVATGPTAPVDLLDAGADVVLDTLEEFPAWLAERLLAERLDALGDLLAALPAQRPVVVAFSGGADSAFVLAAAVRALGADRVVAATAISPSLASGEREAAAAYAASLGVRHLTPHTHELEREGYVANAGDRCYYCKSELVDVLTTLDAALAGVDLTGPPIVLTGTNADDARAGFRPGIRAADERGAVAPLRDAGLTKAQVREASRRWGLVTADKPAAACLSSRIAYGVPVTAAALARVDRAEAAVRSELQARGGVVDDLRVRDLGDGRARIELGAASLAQVTGLRHGEAITDAVRGAGFDSAEIDERGFRSGSMNELLPHPEVFR